MRERHGDKHTLLYAVWCSMKQRCLNKNGKHYKYYGGRGITICEEWKNSYISFKKWALDNGYEKGLTIDRIDVDGNYCTENCRWATKKEQENNKRKTLYITYNDETKPISEWCELLNIPYDTLFSRYSRGWSIDKIIETNNKINIGNTRTDIGYNEIMEVCNKGLNQQEMANELNCGIKVIRERLRKFGIVYDYRKKKIISMALAERQE